VRGRIATVVVVITVGVVHRIHRAGFVTCGRHRRAEAVVVVAVAARTVVVADARRHRDDHPALGARTIPVEANGIEVLEGGEAVEFIAQFVVRHDGEGVPSIDTAERDLQGDSLDASRTHFHVFFVVAITIVRIEVDRDITPIGVVSDVLHVVVDRD
jgi:hypothetical protein